MTEKLYDRDSFCRAFTGRVLSCEPGEPGRWLAELDRTAFFPEGGGQAADTGTLGAARVLDVRERAGHILHTLDAPLTPGDTVEGALDWPQRLRRMQNHTGEHIFSGLVYSRYGYANSGFHLGDRAMTVDYSGELTWAQVLELEAEANRAVFADVPVRAEYPAPEVLAGLHYRSKLDLKENIRIVTVEGYDVCACCAPHVRSTGQVGGLKVTDLMRHRGGVRLTMVCGLTALDDYNEKLAAVQAVSAALSAPQTALPQAVARLQADLQATQYTLEGLRRQLAADKAAALPETEGCLVCIEPLLSVEALRLLVAGAMEKCALCAGFTGSEGDWRYVIAAKSADLRAVGKAVNAALHGRGGGRDRMIQGSAACTRAEIETFFAAYRPK